MFRERKGMSWRLKTYNSNELEKMVSGALFNSRELKDLIADITFKSAETEETELTKHTHKAKSCEAVIEVILVWDGWFEVNDSVEELDEGYYVAKSRVPRTNSSWFTED